MVVKALDIRGDGSVRWFTSPPIVVSEPDPFKHSEKYLEYLSKQPQEMDVDEQVSAPVNGRVVQQASVDVDMEGPKVQPSEKALAQALKGDLYLL